MKPKVRRHAVSLTVVTALLAVDAQAQSTCPTVAALPVTGQLTTSSYFYDAEGNRIQMCDPRSTSSSQIYTMQAFDHLNRPTTMTQPIPGTTGTHPTITPTYDGRDQVTKVVDPRSLNTTYTIDGLGNLTVLASPDTGSTTNVYDAFGNLHTSTDARGDLTSYGYDVLNRVTSITYATGTATGFTYDGGSSPVQYDIGHLTGVSDESGSTRFYYDGYGRIVQKVQTAGSGVSVQTQTVLYSYSETGATTGKLKSLTYPSGNVVGYTYDVAGRVASITLTPVGGTLTTIVSGISYNPFGAPKGWTWGNGGVYARSFDYDGRLASYPLGEMTGTVTPNALMRTAVYDGASRVQSFTHVDTSGSGTSAIALADNATFAYDNLNRLTGYTPATTSQSYGYDLTGNRTTTTIGSSSYTDAIASTSNRLSSTTGPTPVRSNSYDADGDLTGDGTYTYAVSARGRTSSTTSGANVTSYLYNGLGQRVYKSGPTTIVTSGVNYYAYDEAGHQLGEYDTHAQPIEETIYLGDTPISVMIPTVPAIESDNTDSTVVVSGTWAPSTSVAGYIGSNYQTHAASTGTDSFTWNLAIATSGSYHVYARWTAGTNRSTAATYSVNGGGGYHENQQLNGSTWMSLGTYTLSAGTTTVKLTTDSSGYVIADAVKAVPASQDSLTADYVYPDQVDTPRMVTRPSDNQMVWRWDQADPFGSATPNQNPASLGTFVYNKRFPGQTYDQENNLNYNYFRNYDPTLGRYTQSDPIGLSGGINSYLYADGNPVAEYDELGLRSVTVGLFPGIGLQATFGQNPNGSGFVSFQFGWGIGGGASYDGNGQQPGYNPAQGNGWGLGVDVYGSVGARAGPLNTSISTALGRNYYASDALCNANFFSPPKAKATTKASWWGLRGGWSAGGQITFFGGGTVIPPSQQ